MLEGICLRTSVSIRLKESIRYLKLRLGDPSPRVVVLALTLTESIVKNCGELVHQEIASEPFMTEMEALYRVRRARAFVSTECSLEHVKTAADRLMLSWLPSIVVDAGACEQTWTG